MWTLDSRWFDVAAFATLCVVLTVLFGRFEQQKPAWRRLAKLAVLLALLLVLIETTGRAWAYAVLGLLLMAGRRFISQVLTKLGINGWTGEPHDRLEALLRESKLHGEARTILSLARDLLSRRSAGGQVKHPHLGGPRPWDAQ